MRHDRMLNPVIASLPEPLMLPLDALPELAPTLQLLFSEVFSESPAVRLPQIDYSNISLCYSSDQQ